MELVYLWVEEYKNIYHEGFNFSPRFDCKFDGKNLTIEKKEDTSIFPKNINITAIVGENGSGKTTILDRLIYTEDLKPVKLTKLWVKDKDSENIRPTSFDELNKGKNRVILFQDDIDSIDYGNAYTIDNRMEIYETMNNETYDGEITKRYKRHNLALAYLGASGDSILLSELYFIPTHLEIDLSYRHEFRFESLIGTTIKDTDYFILEDDIKKLKKFIQEKIYEAIQYFQEKKDLEYYLIVKSYLYHLYQRHIGSLKILKTKICKKENITLSEFIDYLKKEYFTPIKDKDKEFFRFITNLNHLLSDYKITDNKICLEIKDENVEKILINADRHFFKIDMILYKGEQEIRFKDLSSGEKRLISGFSKLNYIFKKFDQKEVENLIFLLDEPEIYLHPNWQKKYISYLVDFIKKHKILKEKNIHMIITSHSPFMLSDLPKEHVIFLKKDEEGNCQNITDETNIDTFGANIHTLLSHGFFMEDGLMGEFAKERINEAIKYLNQKALSQKEIEYCEDIISIVGEPILKRQLQKMLDSKRLRKIDDIDTMIKDMEYELSVLKKYQKKVTKDELKDRAKRKYTKKKKDDQ